MNIINLVCPRCGGQLQINHNTRMGVCMYCNHQVLLENQMDPENSRQAGFAFEQGKQQAQMQQTANIELANRVYALIEPVKRLPGLTASLNNMKQRYSVLERGCTPDNRFGPATPFILPGGIFLFFFLMAVVSPGLQLGQTGFGLLLADIIYYYRYYKRIGFLKRASGEMESVSRQIEETKKEIHRLTSSFDISIIPPNYRYEEAMLFFSHALANQRAMNMQQAVNLYEEDRHKRNMLQMQQQQIQMQQANLQLQQTQIQMQKKQTRATNLNTAASVALTVGAAVAAKSVLGGIKSSL